MKKTVSPPVAPEIKVFITALAKTTFLPSVTPSVDPPLKKHQHVHN